MHITLLGTGSPIPIPERAGTGVYVDVDGEPLLIDCGPGVVNRMIEFGIDPGRIETLLFTHHHVDHDADFFQFAVVSWSFGREELTVYGPDGSGRLIDALHDLYAEDLDYRRRMGYPEGGMAIDHEEVSDGLVAETDRWRIEATPVDHSIETYGYRIEAVESGATVTVSGDTRAIPAVADLASGSDVLIHDCCVAPVAEDTTADPPLPARLAEPLPSDHRDELLRTHPTPAEAGQIAADAGVETLVLTHLLPYRDPMAIHEEASAVFDGEVIVGEDGMVIEP